MTEIEINEQELWLEHRTHGTAIRNSLISTLTEHGVTGSGYADCINELYRGLFQGSKQEVCTQRDVPYQHEKSLRDYLSTEELVALDVAEQLARGAIISRDAQGNVDCHAACQSASQRVLNLWQNNPNPEERPLDHELRKYIKALGMSIMGEIDTSEALEDHISE